MVIGVIAEESNDIEVLYEITRKVIRKRQFSFKRHVSHGCGKLRRKCAAWAVDLVNRGCSHIVVLHDRDRGDEKELRSALEGAILQSKAKKCVVLIPVEEVEAWLLSDIDAIRTVFGIKKQIKALPNPEAIESPKEYLRNLVYHNAKVRYMNTVHNRKIASAVSLDRLNCCPSFRAYPKFLSGKK